MTSEKKIRIGELSKQTGVSVRMLRHYEKFGLLQPNRNSKYRAYPSASRLNVAKIRFFQDLGFSIRDVSKLLPLLKSQSKKQAGKAITDQIKTCSDDISKLEKRQRWLSRVQKLLSAGTYGRQECSFCGTPKTTEEKLIAGPTDFICGSCVAW